jgi:hypothetical protein
MNKLLEISLGIITSVGRTEGSEIRSLQCAVEGGWCEVDRRSTAVQLISAPGGSDWADKQGRPGFLFGRRGDAPPRSTHDATHTSPRLTGPAGTSRSTAAQTNGMSKVFL